MRTILLMFVAVALCMAQTGLRYTTPALIPAVDSAVFTATVNISQITLTNETSSDVTCYIKTKQSTPRTLFGGTVTANTLYVMSYPAGYQSPSGLSWYCSSGTAVSSQIAYRQ